MHLIARILHSNLFRQQHHGPFTRAVGCCTGFQADQAQHARCVDDPAAVAGGVGWLGEELLDGVFAAEEDGAGVDVPKI